MNHRFRIGDRVRVTGILAEFYPGKTGNVHETLGYSPNSLPNLPRVGSMRSPFYAEPFFESPLTNHFDSFSPHKRATPQRGIQFVGCLEASGSQLWSNDRF